MLTPDIQTSHKLPITIGEHAVVIGGSVAGLLAARVLSDYFSRVTIFEADTVSDQAVPRRRVPQGGHAHTLLAGGSLVMQRLYPGLHEDLIAAGARYGDMITMSHIHGAGRWAPRWSSGIFGYFMSRPLLEAIVRKHTCAIKNVQLRSNESVSGYLGSAGNSTITGVMLEKSSEKVSADFVVDTTGRNSSTPDWLSQLGYETPKKTTIGINVGYTTFELPVSKNADPNRSALYFIPNTATETRGLALFNIEGNRYMVTGAGTHKDYPPTDWPGFLEFAKGFSQPNIYDEIKDLKPLGSARHFRYGESLRHHYEHLRRFPLGLIVLGDAICSFNPSYSQGMTVAAKEAECLAACIQQCLINDGNLNKLAIRFFKNVAADIIDVSWNGVALLDLKNPLATGSKPWGYNFAYWFQLRCFLLSTVDKEFNIAYNKVLHMIEPQKSLLKLRYVLRAIFNYKIN